MAIVYVNGANSGALIVSPTSPITCTLNVTTGNFVIVNLRCTQSSSVTISSVSDTAGNTWTVGSKLNIGTNTMIQSAYAYNVTGNASDVITVNYSSTAGFAQIWADQFSGIQTSSTPFDSTATGTGGTSVTSGTYSTVQNNELAYAIASAESASGSWTAGTGFTAAQAAPASQGVASFSEYQIYSSIQSGVTASVSGNTTGAAAGLIVYTFKAVTTGVVRKELLLLGVGL